MPHYSSPQIDQDQDTKDQETKTSCDRPSLLCSKYTREGELCVCTNERNLTSIYTHNWLLKRCNPKRGCFDFYNKDNNKIIMFFWVDLYNKIAITLLRFDQYKYKKISSIVTSKYQHSILTRKEFFVATRAHDH